jgi:hypothetical protein
LDGHADASETVATHARNDCFEAKSQAATTDRLLLARTRPWVVFVRVGPFAVGLDPAQSTVRMESLQQRIQMAERLAVITQRLGFVLWQLQELEGISALYFVLVAQARQGTGLAEGQTLVETALRKTFGATIREMTKADLLSVELETRLTRLLSERNWLVHKSRTTNRSAVHNDGSMQQLLLRLGSIADESDTLLHEFGALAERHVKQRGVSAQYIQAKADALLEQWHSADA